MEPLTILLMAFAVFVLFLMLTSGHRKHRLEQILRDLESQRMHLLKSIEHVKLSFFQKRLGEKEAQDKIFEYEEKLRGIESKILDLKEKPLIRTVKKHEEPAESAAGYDDAKAEAAEVEGAEKKIMEHAGAKSIVFLFAAIILGIIIIMALGGGMVDQDWNEPEETVEIPVETYTVPEGGSYPGSNAGLRIDFENNLDRELEGVLIKVVAPEDSGIKFEYGEVGLNKIAVLEEGGERNLFFPISIGPETAEGQYMLEVEISDDKNLLVTDSAGLIVSIGAPKE